MSEKRDDILPWLRAKAGASKGEDRVRFLQAIEIIETLRTLVEIRDEILLADMEPEGRA